MFGFGTEKIPVHILGKSQLRRRRKCNVTGLQGDKVIIRKGKGVRGDPDILAEFDDDCIVYYRNKFGLLKRYLVWKEGHKRCVKFFGQKVNVSAPDPKGFFQRGVLKTFGSTIQTIKVPAFLYLAIGLVIVMQLVGFLVQSGRLVL